MNVSDTYIFPLTYYRFSKGTTLLLHPVCFVYQAVVICNLSLNPMSLNPMFIVPESVIQYRLFNRIRRRVKIGTNNQNDLFHLENSRTSQENCGILELFSS